MVVFYSQRGDLAQVRLHEGSCTGLLAQLFLGVAERNVDNFGAILGVSAQE